MLKKELLQDVICPETHARVSIASAEMVAETNRKIAGRLLKNRAGEVVREPIDGGLIREDGKVLYLIRKNIPVMLIDQGVLLDQE